MEIPITFLGTGQAIPTASRNHSAIFLSYKNEHILVDCGEGTQRQFRKAKINMGKITRLLITHWHGDHILGIPGMLQTLSLNDYNKTLHIYGPKRTKKFMETLYSLFIHKRKINIEIHEISSGKVFETKDLIVEAKPMKHGTPCLAYSIKEKDRLRINKSKLKKLKIPSSPLVSKLKQGKDIKIKGKIIKASQLTYKVPGKKITLILDTAKNPNSIKLAKNSDLVICEATYLENEKELAKKYQHLTAKQAGEIAKSSKSKKLILTHLSQRYEHKENKLLDEARKIYKNTKIVNDLDKVEV